MTLTDAAARAAATPGLVLRPYAGEADIPEMVRIQNAEWEADGVEYRETIEDQIAFFGHTSPQSDARRDVTIAEVDGRIVGFARRDWVDTSDGLREYRSRGAVDPEWRRRGVGTALLVACERAASALAGGHDVDRPRCFGTFTEDRNAGASALAERMGYEPARWFFDMERPGIDRDLPPIAALPAGVEVRPVSEEHLLQIWRADVEAFRDHWGGGDDSVEAFRRYRDSPSFDPSLWVVAWDGDEVVAACINTIYAHENQASGQRKGWLDSVFTRRPWRRRGIAGALIDRSLHRLAERGMEAAALGVDADNPSGALRLYESHGFAITSRGTAWRKPIEEVMT